MGNHPQRIAITPDGTRAYLAIDGVPGGVSVIDLTTNTVVATIPVGNGPGSIAITPDGTKVYVGIGGALQNDPQFVSGDRCGHPHGRGLADSCDEFAHSDRDHARWDYGLCDAKLRLTT